MALLDPCPHVHFGQIGIKNSYLLKCVFNSKQQRKWRMIIEISAINVIIYVLFKFPRDSYPMLLVANKVDLVHLRKVTEEQGRELSVKLNIPYIETSAKDPPLNVDSAFHEVKVIPSVSHSLTLICLLYYYYSFPFLIPSVLVRRLLFSSNTASQATQQNLNEIKKPNSFRCFSLFSISFNALSYMKALEGSSKLLGVPHGSDSSR